MLLCYTLYTHLQLPIYKYVMYLNNTNYNKKHSTINPLKYLFLYGLTLHTYCKQMQICSVFWPAAVARSCCVVGGGGGWLEPGGCGGGQLLLIVAAVCVGWRRGGWLEPGGCGGGQLLLLLVAAAELVGSLGPPVAAVGEAAHGEEEGGEDQDHPAHPHHQHH